MIILTAFLSFLFFYFIATINETTVKNESTLNDLTKALEVLEAFILVNIATSLFGYSFGYYRSFISFILEVPGMSLGDVIILNVFIHVWLIPSILLLCYIIRLRYGKAYFIKKGNLK